MEWEIFRLEMDNSPFILRIIRNTSEKKLIIKAAKETAKIGCDII